MILGYRALTLLNMVQVSALNEKRPHYAWARVTDAGVYASDGAMALFFPSPGEAPAYAFDLSWRLLDAALRAWPRGNARRDPGVAYFSASHLHARIVCRGSEVWHEPVTPAREAPWPAIHKLAQAFEDAPRSECERLPIADGLTLCGRRMAALLSIAPDDGHLRIKASSQHSVDLTLTAVPEPHTLRLMIRQDGAGL